MNTIKLFQVEGQECLYLYIREHVIYKIMDGVVVYGATLPINAEEVAFDITLMGMLDNAKSNLAGIVTNYAELELLTAIAVEKAEDFD